MTAEVLLDYYLHLMSQSKLPKSIDPVKFAEQHGYLEGALALADMPRLCDVGYIKQALTKVIVTLAGDVDVQDIRYLHGTAKVTLELICQRCLQPFKCDLNTEFKLSPVHNDAEAELLPTTYEALFVPQGEMALVDIIEDELLLVLPLVPKHADKNCAYEMLDLMRTKLTMQMSNENTQINPFAKLAKLKQKTKTDK